MDIAVGTTSHAPPQQGLALQQLVALFRRHAWLIALCALLGAAGAFAYVRTVPKTFTASGLIAVEGDRFAIPELQGALRSENAPDPMPWVRTEMQAVTSRDLLLSVIRRLQLANVPEFDPDLQPPSLTQQAKALLGTFFPGDEPAADPAMREEAVLGLVSRRLAVFQDNRSLVIEVSFTSRDPARSAAVVNTLVSEYIASRAKRRVQANQGANSALTERIDQVRQELADIEKQTSDLRTSGELVGLRAGSVGQQQLEELATAAARATVERGQLQTQFDRATALARQGSSDALASVLGSATIQRLREQEATATRRVAELSTRYGSGYPGVKSAQAEAGSAQRQLRDETQRIVASLGTQLRAARQNEADVQKQLDEARRAGVLAENARAQLEQLQREGTTRRGLYQTLLERAQQTVTQPTGSETPDVRVVSQAAPPLGPSGPNMKLATGAGGAAGIVLGGLLTLTRRHRMPASPLDLLAPGMPPALVLHRPHPGRGRSALPARVAAASTGTEADELRAIRNRVMRLGRSSVPRSLAVVGAGTGNDAAAVATALARVAALDGERVLLVECDLGAPHVAGWTGETPGLEGLLEDGGDWRSVAMRDALTPLDLLAAARPARRANALLGSAAFQNLLVEAQANYDLVVLAGPGASTPGAVQLAQRADVTALVAGAGDGASTLTAALDRLGTSSRNPLILVRTGK